MCTQLHEIILRSANSMPEKEALIHQNQVISYSILAHEVLSVARGYIELGLQRHERVAVYLEKRPETVSALFGAAAGGGVLVPVNPLLKPEQVAYILRDCNARILVTSPERLQLLAGILPECRDLRHVIVAKGSQPTPEIEGLNVIQWDELITTRHGVELHRGIDGGMAAIIYTSGSTGKPKGVVLSHRNMIAGARSVVSYLENNSDDRILAVLPLSFDYGFSQLTHAFLAGASVTLLNYLLPRDVINAVHRHKITGLAAVPSLWIQLAQLEWPEQTEHHLRYITSSGGTMPRTVLQTLRTKLPATQIYLMYGFTEAFRSTYLPPSELNNRPDSIGRAIPNAEIQVVRNDGTPCDPGEPGELVHSGILVAMGYWNDAERTAEQFRPAPNQPPGIIPPQTAAWSGDLVSRDGEGYLYFLGRKDDMIKTSGYRVSPSEIEEIIHDTGLIGEVAAFGVPHPTLGQAIVVVACRARENELNPETLLTACKRRLPPYMVPALIKIQDTLPRNHNGKIDRRSLAEKFKHTFMDMVEA